MSGAANATAASRKAAEDAAEIFVALTCATIASATRARTILGVDAVRKTIASTSARSQRRGYRAAATPSAAATVRAIASDVKPRQSVLTDLVRNRLDTGTRE